MTKFLGTWATPEETKSAVSRHLIALILNDDPNIELVVCLYRGVIERVYLRQHGRDDDIELNFVVDDYPDGHE